jgi:hypothetical protein
MALFDIIGTYTNASVVDGPEIAAEYENIYDAFNGNSTDKEIHHKFNGTEPALIIDQLGAGPIARFRQNGVDKLIVANDGKITNDNVVKEKFTWFIQSPTNASNFDGEEGKVFIVPNGIGMRLTKLSIIRRGGSHSAGGILGYALTRLSPVNTIIESTGPRLNDTNNLANTEYSVVLNFAISPNDVIVISQFPHTDPVTETGITVILEWEQKLG